MMRGMASEQSKAEREIRRRMATARRELRTAVERASKVDLREGHVAEAVRLAREVKAAADALVKALDPEEPRGLPLCPVCVREGKASTAGRYEGKSPGGTETWDCGHAVGK